MANWPDVGWGSAGLNRDRNADPRGGEGRKPRVTYGVRDRLPATAKWPGRKTSGKRGQIQHAWPVAGGRRPELRPDHGSPSFAFRPDWPASNEDGAPSPCIYLKSPRRLLLAAPAPAETSSPKLSEPRTSRPIKDTGRRHEIAQAVKRTTLSPPHHSALPSYMRQPGRHAHHPRRRHFDRP